MLGQVAVFRARLGELRPFFEQLFGDIQAADEAEDSAAFRLNHVARETPAATHGETAGETGVRLETETVSSETETAGETGEAGTASGLLTGSLSSRQRASRKARSCSSTGPSLIIAYGWE